jgi:hypothetical protein
MTAIEIINQIEADKRTRLIEPHFATLLDIESVAKNSQPVITRDIIRAELIQLWKDKKIRVGDTLNGNYITIL